MVPVGTLKSLMASVCRACEGSVVRGDDKASLLKHSTGCLQLWDAERQTHTVVSNGNQKLLQTPYFNSEAALTKFISLIKYGVKYKNGTQKKGPMTLTWISIHLKEFSNQLLKLCAKFTHRGAHRHRQMVQPWILQSRNTFKGHDL